MSRLRPLVGNTAFAGACVFALAFALRFGFWAEVRGTPLDSWHEWEQTDMATYLEQARELREVDWLAPRPVHPYHDWQQIAPPEKWLEWYGEGQFHQAPAYAYALAALATISAEPLSLLKAFQLLIGSLSCVMALGLATRLAGPVAGWTTGTFAALYGPLFHLEGQVLREGLGVFGLLALSVLLVRYVEGARWPLRAGDPRRDLRAAAALGVGLGLYAMFHEMGTVMTIAGAIVVTASALAWRRSTAAAVFVALLLGYAIGFAPLLARNVAVGAPPFSVSCRTLVNFVHANEADAPGGGAIFSAGGPSEHFVEILDEADGSFVAALGGVWRSYDGDVGRLAGNTWRRFATIWHRGEIPDNTSYEFFASRSAVLRPLPTFASLFPLGIVGIGVSLFAGARRLRAGSREADDGVDGWDGRAIQTHAVLALVFVGLLASLTLIHTVARFRLYVVPILWIYSGVFVAAFVSASLGGRRRQVAGMLVAVAIAAGVQGLLSSNPPDTRPRRVDYSFAQRLALQRFDTDLGLELAEEGAVHYPRYGAWFANLGAALERQGREREALRYYERAYAMQPKLGGLSETIERVRRGGRGGPGAGPPFSGRLPSGTGAPRKATERGEIPR